MQDYNVLPCTPVDDSSDEGDSDDPDDRDRRLLLPRPQMKNYRQKVLTNSPKLTSVTITAERPLLRSFPSPKKTKPVTWTKTAQHHLKGFFSTSRQIATRSWLNVLLIFVPFGIASNAMGLQPIITFVLNALAIMPLTSLLTFATETAALSLGVSAGALLNITFGNLVEFVILFMLREGHLRLVLSSLLGSIFVNLLFILGLATIVGGYKYKDHKHNKKTTQVLIYFMNLGVLSLLVPTSLHASIEHLHPAKAVTLQFSRGICLPLFVLYGLYLHFLLRFHPEVAEGTTKTISDEEMIEAQCPDPQNTFIENHTSSCQPEESKTSMQASVILLITSACVVSFCAENMVNSIEHVVANARLTEAFLGLIILPLVGNTAELVTAVTVASKNKTDLAINVTVGSAIQITLFMVPAMVALGWVSGKDVTLFFDMFQTASLLVAMIMVSFLLISGRSSYMMGAMLFVGYVIIGIGAFVLPNQRPKKTQVN